MGNSHDNNCFYCTYCQRIKVNGIHVDWYCEKHYCLTDNVDNCKDFIHVGSNNEERIYNVLRFDGSYSDKDSGVYVGEKRYKLYELYQMIFELYMDKKRYQKERQLLAQGLLDVASTYNDYSILSEIFLELDKR